MMELMERARLAGMEKFVDVDTVNRGWYVNLLTGKKVRMTEQELADQARFIDEQLVEMAKEEAPVPTMDNIVEEPKKAPKKATKDTVVVLHDAELGEYEITEKLHDHIEASKLAGRPIKTVIVKCEDCGTLRMVKVQDQFQTTRCVACAREQRNARRRKANKSSK